MVSFSKEASGGRAGSTRGALTADSVWKPYGWLRKALSWPAQDTASAAVPWLVVRCCELCFFFWMRLYLRGTLLPGTKNWDQLAVGKWHSWELCAQHRAWGESFLRCLCLSSGVLKPWPQALAGIHSSRYSLLQKKTHDKYLHKALLLELRTYQTCLKAEEQRSRK